MIVLSFKLRKFTENDLLEINRIETASFSDIWPDTFFVYNHRKAPDLFLIAEDNNRLLGYVVGEIREAMFSGRSYMSKMGHILNLAVDPNIRRKGVGSKLMKGIEDRFREAGATKITLEVRESNVEAQDFYKKRGFQEIGRVRAYYPDEDAIIMCKTFN